MANQLLFSATITPATAAMEVSINGGSSFTALAFTGSGSSRTGTLTGVPGGSYPAGQLVLRAKGFAASTTFPSLAGVTVVDSPTVATDNLYLDAYRTTY